MLGSNASPIWGLATVTALLPSADESAQSRFARQSWTPNFVFALQGNPRFSLQGNPRFAQIPGLRGRQSLHIDPGATA